MSELVSRPPVEFALSNAAGEPTLTIGDGLAVNVLSFAVTNQTAAALALFAGTPVPDGQADPDGPTTVYIYFGNLLTPAQVKQLSITAPAWVATFVAGAWALTPTASGSLAPGASVTFTISHVDVDGPPQDGHLIVDYSRLGNVPNGFTQRPLLVVPAATGGDPILHLQVGFGTGLSTVVTTVDASQPYVNALSLQLSTDAPSVAPTWDPAKPPLLLLSFLYEESTPGGALTTRALASHFKPSLVPPPPHTAAAWSLDPEPSGEDPVWTLRGTGLAPILGPGSVVELTIDSIVSPLRPGPTQLSVRWMDVPGFAPGVSTAVIQKIAPLAIGAISFDPLWIPKGQSFAPTLSWSTTGDPTTLELVAPRDTPLDDAVATSMVSPVAITASTAFTLRAMRACDTAVAVGSATFPVADFPATSTGKIDPPEVSGPAALCRPPGSQLLYVACSSNKNFAGNLSASVLIFDAQTKAQIAQIDQEWPRPPGAKDEVLGPSVWIAPNVTPGVHRVAMAGQGLLVVWDIAADHTATKRSSTAQPANASFMGFRPTGTIGAVIVDLEALSRQFTVVEVDPLGVQPPRQLGPVFGGDGTFFDFMLTADGAHVVYVGWIGPLPPVGDGDQWLETPGRAVVRKSRLADGALIDEVTLGTWPFGMVLMVAMAVPLAEMPDGTVVMYTPGLLDAESSTDPSSDPPADPTTDPPLPFAYGLMWMPLDGSGRSSMSSPGGSFRLHVTGEGFVIPPQYSPNGTDVVITNKDGLWIAPANRPDLGVTVPVGSPLLPVVFSPDGDEIAVVVQDPNISNSFEVVTLARSVAPASQITAG